MAHIPPPGVHSTHDAEYLVHTELIEICFFLFFFILQRCGNWWHRHHWWVPTNLKDSPFQRIENYKGRWFQEDLQEILISHMLFSQYDGKQQLMENNKSFT